MQIINTADILLPKGGFEKWAVIACDQFTSQPDYWDAVEDFVGDAPSALRLILPEIELHGNVRQKIDAINRNMENYLQNGVFQCRENAMVYVRRQLSNGKTRQGIIAQISLADYDYRKGAKAQIRATEETVLERIPPRVEIRKDAPLELPHVMLFVDDPENTVIKPLEKRAQSFETLYDFDLMQGGGHICGALLDANAIAQVQAALQQLCRQSRHDFLFAVGDGNHSLAAAKECAALNGSPAAQNALVEIVNIHDPAIEFEPIYRVLFGVDPSAALQEIKQMLCSAKGEGTQSFTAVYQEKQETFAAPGVSGLPVGTLQKVLDTYLHTHPQVKIDYIHGIDTVRALCKEKNTLGFLFDGMRKDQLFDVVARDGALPRKTFSMGTAQDKRYYIEGRAIR